MISRRTDSGALPRAFAVDVYRLRMEQLIDDGDIFLFPVAVISTHFIKTFLPNGHRYLHL